ncbi:hypothetical protein TWF506_010248 [Arthrobotrys conoides]|uniref:Uncharacterized protein n=1 Tax=Arthrobotrys conoides TaxID=74498 RepID=A0AAN8NR39_9PEZI
MPRLGAIGTKRFLTNLEATPPAEWVVVAPTGALLGHSAGKPPVYGSSIAPIKSVSMVHNSHKDCPIFLCHEVQFNCTCKMWYAEEREQCFSDNAYAISIL